MEEPSNFAPLVLTSMLLLVMSRSFSHSNETYQVLRPEISDDTNPARRTDARVQKLPNSQEPPGAADNRSGDLAPPAPQGTSCQRAPLECILG